MMPAWLRSERALFLALVATGVVVRVVLRHSVPNGFNNDEASLGYDAYSILKFGADRHGIAYPAFLIGWGSGMNALAAYVAMPFIAVFGLTESSVRSANLLGGLVSLPVFYWLARRAAGPRTALWGLFLLALCPWHVMMSRWALESNLLPSVFLLAVFLLVKGTERPRFFPLAAICFALCLYAYGTAYFAVPIFLLLASAHVLWTRGVAWRIWGISVALFSLVAMPIAAVIWTNQQHVASWRLAGIGIPLMPTVARYQTVSSLFDRHVLAHFLKNLEVMWGILVKQDDGRIWNAFGDHGIIYPFGMALALIGLLVELGGPWRRRRTEPRVIMLIWLVVALGLGMVQDGNINRLNILWPALVYFAAVGLRTVAKTRLLAVGLVAVHLALFSGFCADYFGPYRDRTAGAFYPGYGAAIRAATQAVPGKICVTNSPCFSYAFVAFYARSDPREFAKTVGYKNEDGEFQGVKSFGRFTFGIERCPEDTEAWILDNGDVDRFRDRAARIEKFANYSAVIAAKK